MDRRHFIRVAGIGSTLAALSASAEGAATPNTASSSLATAAMGQTAFEFVGWNEQNGTAITHYGFLTHIANLADELLFSDATTRTEATALFTFVATTTLDSRHELGNLITTSAAGELRVFRNEAAGASFSDPASFGRGTAVASFDMRYFNVLNVQAPNQGIATTHADLTQTAAAALTLGTEPAQFGRSGLRLRLLATGEGTRTQVSPPQSFFVVGASAVVVG